MNFSKILLCAAAIATAAIFSSCSKDKESTTTTVTVSMSFTTTSDIDGLTTRQYEITVNGNTSVVKNISGTSFSATESLIGITAPATIDVKCCAGFSAISVPASLSALSGYDITCTTSKGFANKKDSGVQRTITQAQFSDFLNNELNFTVHFKLNEDGSISKL